jgi:hypothetical protein
LIVLVAGHLGKQITVVRVPVPNATVSVGGDEASIDWHVLNVFDLAEIVLVLPGRFRGRVLVLNLVHVALDLLHDVLVELFLLLWRWRIAALAELLFERLLNDLLALRYGLVPRGHVPRIADDSTA